MLLGTINLLPGVRFLLTRFQKSRHKFHRNHNRATLNSLKISEMSLTILSYMRVLCRRAHLVKRRTFLGISILMFFACALRHCRVMTGYYVTLKYQAKLRTTAWKGFATLNRLTHWDNITRVSWRSTIDLCSLNLPKLSFENVSDRWCMHQWNRVFFSSAAVVPRKVNLPSCVVGRRPLCHKVNLPRCETRRRDFIMTCDIFDTGQMTGQVVFLKESGSEFQFSLRHIYM